MANETTENELNETGEPGTEYFMETLPGQDRYVAPLDETPLQDVDSVDESAPATSMWADAWRTLRRNPLFIISGLLILFIIVVAIAPGLFTKQDPNACDLGNSLSPASAGHPFGYDLQGCDVYTRVVYGTRTSLSVGVLSTLLVVIVGTLIGAVAGFFGGWVDAVLSRITDIFFALPMLLGAIVVLQMFKTSKSIWKIVLVLTLFGWVAYAYRPKRRAGIEEPRIQHRLHGPRSTPARNLFRHILPNSLPASSSIATTSLAPTSWPKHPKLPWRRSADHHGELGWRYLQRTDQPADRSDGAVLPVRRTGHHRACVIMMGDAVKDALDPRAVRLSEGSGGIIMSQNVLEVKNLCKYFEVGKGLTLKAVDDVSFEIAPGETLGLVGESGCGKTTCGRTCIGLYNKTFGEVLYKGKNVHELKGKEKLNFRKETQMIFQDPYASLDPRMTVADIVAEGLDIHHMTSNKKERSEKIYHYLDLVGLNKEHANRFVHEFSGGQRQRIGIARALAVEPKFLVLDEPISALDVSIQAQIVNLLIKLQKEMDLTYLFVAHDLSMVKHISDRVAVMYLGSMVEITSSEELYKNPLHPYTQALLSAIPIPDPEVEIAREKTRIKLEGDVPSPVNLRRDVDLKEDASMQKKSVHNACLP